MRCKYCDYVAPVKSILMDHIRREHVTLVPNESEASP